MIHDKHIAGYCPMGCGRTLFQGLEGRVTCSYIGCPRPSAVDEILGNAETEHIFLFTEVTFSIKHPLRERIQSDLLTCPLTGWAASFAKPPVSPGMYRVRENADHTVQYVRVFE